MTTPPQSASSLSRAGSSCEPTNWRGRTATRLSNDKLELVILHGGGHLAHLGLRSPRASTNVLWEAPWTTADPGTAQHHDLSRAYGDPAAGRFLAGYTGHALCVDTFGMPSPAAAAAGVSLHGEAATTPWHIRRSADSCTGSVSLKSAGLSLERKLHLRANESVIHVTENVTNTSTEPHTLHWVQHVSFGPPFLAPQASALSASVHRSIAWPLGYEGHGLLQDDSSFAWPLAKRTDSPTDVDLSLPFQQTGTGFVAASQFDLNREDAFIAAINWQQGLAAGYCFLRSDFPWLAIWEENCARTSAPWSCRAQVRGMEFGTTPLPLGHEETARRGPLFDTPTSITLASHSSRTIRYLIFVAAIPQHWRSLANVTLAGDTLTVHGSLPTLGLQDTISLTARGCQTFLAPKATHL
jgi:Domain of unknown function (DUF4432)